MPKPNGPRALIAAGLVLMLAACNAGGLGTSEDSPFAPGTDDSGQQVDPLVVGYRLSAAGEHELALKSFNRAAAEHGLTTEIVSAIGTANLGLGRLGQAETLMRRATDAEDATPEDWNNLGVVLMEQGKTAEAAQVFRRAYATDNGNSDEIRDNLRLALAKIENPASVESNQNNGFELVRRGSGDFVLLGTPS